MNIVISPIKHKATRHDHTFAHVSNESLSTCQCHFTHHEIDGIQTLRLPLGIDDSVLRPLAKRFSRKDQQRVSACPTPLKNCIILGGTGRHVALTSDSRTDAPCESTQNVGLGVWQTKDMLNKDELSLELVPYQRFSQL